MRNSHHVNNNTSHLLQKIRMRYINPILREGLEKRRQIDRSGASYIKSQRTETFGVAVLKEKDRFTRIPLRKLPYSLAISGPCLLSMTTRQPALSHMTTACCQYWLCPSVSKAAGTCWNESTHARHQGQTRNHVICFLSFRKNSLQWSLPYSGIRKPTWSLEDSIVNPSLQEVDQVGNAYHPVGLTCTTRKLFKLLEHVFCSHIRNHWTSIMIFPLTSMVLGITWAATDIAWLTIKIKPQGWNQCGHPGIFEGHQCSAPPETRA